MKHKMKTIQSKLYHLKNYKTSKIYLSYFDDKHHKPEDQIKPLA